ncbi:FeS cluster assembly protein SufD [Candidatus Providencia siddallii]|uniref:FeS cluster assembly protein SufD n=1 Tax=Candidatus Providencia siddallii TaxID=1715285 RepID=A0A0M6W6I6_9GAMM|nr:FeS cluster assembly protein SufD [Candidatus Providencia siddallii]
MIGLLNNNEKAEKHDQIKIINKQKIIHFFTLFKHRIINSQHAKNHLEMAKQTIFKLFNNEIHNSIIFDKMLKTKYSFNNSISINNKKYKSIALPIDAYRIVFINGYYSKKLSSTDMDPFCISNNQNALPKPITNEFFLHLTEYLTIKPLVIYLPADKNVKKPLYLLNISSGNKNKQETDINQYRYHLIINSNNKIQVIEHFVSLNQHSHMTCSRLTVEIKDNVEYNHFKLNTENKNAKHFAHNDIIIGYNNKIKSNTFLLGSLLTRNQTSVRFDGKYSDLDLNSLLISKNNEISETQTYLKHNNSYCNSKQLHKIIAMDSSKAIFNGLIDVAPTTMKINSKMINNTLLLGKKSEINSKPQLEIYADDVKCSHGATVDYIDKDQLFYLCSRGIDNKTAKHMIIITVASELIETITLKEFKDTVITNLYKILSKVE